jgi:hypothetical protein
MVDWWLPSRKRVHKHRRKGFDTLFALVIWLERNARVFNRKSLRADQLADRIKAEGLQWSLAGFSELIH